MAELERRESTAFPLALSLLAPFFFLSMAFALLAPLPILYLHQGTPDRALGRLWALFSIPVGLGICWLLKGPWGGISFLVFTAMPAFIGAEVLERTRNPIKAITVAALSSAAAMTVALLVVCALKHAHVLAFVRGFISALLYDVHVRITTDPNFANGPISADEIRKLANNPDQIIQELPGLLLAGSFALSALSMITLIRWNPKGLTRRLGIRRDFLRRFRSPDWLIWPSLFTLAFLIFETPIATPIALNLFKPLLLIYFFQGMSILAFFLDSFRIRGLFRVLVYGLGIVFLTPMVVSFGFFDLWFNFRGRWEDRQQQQS